MSIFIAVPEVDSVSEYLSCRWFVQTDKMAQQCALSTAALALDNHDFTLVDVKCDVFLDDVVAMGHCQVFD